MANTLTYDPSNDPDITAVEEARDAELLSIGQEMEDQQNDLLAGKFRDAEALEAAYLELQRKLGSRTDEADTEPEPEEETEEQPEEQPEEESHFLDDLFSEIQELGQLSQETAEALGEDVATAIEQLVANQQSSVELSSEETQQIQGIVGGDEAYNQMISWSSSNLSEGEKDAYNEVMNSGNVNAIYWAVKGLQSSYLNAVGYDGTMIQGRAAADQQGFRSMAELVRAQRDPRYDSDPAFRADIEAKVLRSGNLT
jgi:hypothetical protein